MYKKLTDDTKAVQTVDCAFDRCPLPARFYVKRPQGYANVCKIHYEEIASREAAASCQALGIHTAKQAHAYVTARLPGVGKTSGTDWARRILERHAAGENVGYLSLTMAREALPPRMREPGEDEGEKEVAV